MPRFELQGPDGKTYEVDAPDMHSAASVFGQMAPKTPGSELSVDNIVRSVARGIPVLGGAMDNIAAAGDAATHVVLGRGSDAPTFSERYAANLRKEQGQDATFDREHPIASGAAQLAGGVAGTVPMVTAAPAAFGAGAGGLASRATMSGLSGAALGGADQAVRSGGDVGEAVKGAAFGGVLGLAAPAVGAAAGKAYNAAADYLGGASNAITGISPAATRYAASTVLDPGRRAALAQELQRLGPEAMLADVSPEWMGVARGAASRPGSRDPIVNALLERDAAKNARLGTDIDRAIGPAPVPSQVEAGIAQGQEALGPRYGEAIANSTAVDTQHIADRLDGVASILRGPAQRAVGQVRGMLNVPGTNVLDPHPSALLQTRQAIDGLMATEQNPQVIRQLTMARQEVDDALAQAVPGIKNVDAQYAELARQREGLQRGSQVLDSGKTAIRPQELAQEFPAAALPQGTMVGPSAVPLRIQQGARAELDRVVGQNANDPAALLRAVKTEGDWNRDKLRTIFGPSADDVLSAIDREVNFYRTTDQVARNSVTSVGNGFRDFLDAAATPNKIPVESTLTGLLIRALQKGAGAATQSAADAKAARFADELGRLSVARGAERDAAYQAISDAAGRQQARLPSQQRAEDLARALLAAGSLQVERGVGAR